MARKTLEELLSENAAKPGLKDATRRLATFLAYWDEIEDAYQKGWPWSQIYNALAQGGIVDYSYSTFLHYKEKKRRRELEALKREEPRMAGGAKETPPDQTQKTPGSTRVDLPVLGQGVKQRDAKRF